MKLIDFLRTAPVEKIAEEVYVRGEGYKVSDWRLGFDHGEFFREEKKCPVDCKYLLNGWAYEDSWMNGLCDIEDNETCPYSIDRVQVQRKQFIDWLNSEIDVEES